MPACVSAATRQQAIFESRKPSTLLLRQWFCVRVCHSSTAHIDTFRRWLVAVSQMSSAGQQRTRTGLPAESTCLLGQFVFCDSFIFYFSLICTFRVDLL